MLGLVLLGLQVPFVVKFRSLMVTVSDVGRCPRCGGFRTADVRGGANVQSRRLRTDRVPEET